MNAVALYQNLKSFEDSALLNEMRGADPIRRNIAVKIFIERYQDRFFSFTKGILGKDIETVYDLLQSVYGQLFKKTTLDSCNGNLLGLTFLIIRRRVKDYHRQPEEVVNINDMTTDEYIELGLEQIEKSVRVISKYTDQTIFEMENMYSELAKYLPEELLAILELMRQGYTQRVMAIKLDMSENQIHTRVGKIKAIMTSKIDLIKIVERSAMGTNSNLPQEILFTMHMSYMEMIAQKQREFFLASK